MTVRIGVIGAGRIGADHVHRLTELVNGAEVLAVSDVDGERARSVAEPIGAKVFEDGRELIKDRAVDAVVVTSLGATHAEYVLAALEVGKPVFCEKPLATTAEDCLRIVRAEVELGRRLVQVGFMRRYDAGYRAMKRVIESGEIGSPLLMHCVHRNVSAPETYESAMAVRDTAVHELDAIRWLLDTEILRARVHVPRSTSRKFAHLRDPQLMLFETADGACVDLEVFVNCQYGYDIQCETVGELGTVRLPDPADVWLRGSGQLRTGIQQDWTTRFAEAFDREFTEWVAAVEVGAPRGPSAWDGYAVAVSSDAAVRALETGESVDVVLTERPALYRD